ncbi:MAG: TlpA disulfide reductase family protein [Candidatus Acidiferrum sp.]|jgi:cytochrome c biogenesis protein CcmG/thiol:disulfide interchange protein DsbE
MKIGPRILAWGGLAAFLGIFVVFALPSYRHGEASVAGERAANFALELGGKPAHLSDLRGKIVVLNFWATWCPPCIEETPGLNQLQKYIASRNGVVLGVAADGDQSVYEQFLRDHAVDFPTYRDPGTTNNHSPIAARYGTSMYPETYIIGRDGKIARKIIGFQEWDSPQMRAYFDSILGKS